MTSPSNVSGPQLRDLAVAMAGEAGALLAGFHRDELHASSKSTPTDTVTAADKAAEELIVRRIGENRPDDGILGEEGTSRAGSSGVRWIVDPLDGTVNYLYGQPAWSVSIAAEVNGEVWAGAVYDGRTGGLFEAVRGDGARYEGQPLAVTNVTKLEMALVGTGFGYAAQVRADQGAVVARLLPQVRDIRRSGSAALELCSVAAGRLDAFYERGIEPWDRAAGLLIAAEAGARTAVLAEPGTDRELTITAAPAVFEPLLAAITARP